MGKVLEFEHKRKQARVKALKDSLRSARKFGPENRDPAKKLKDIFRGKPPGRKNP